MKKYLAFAAFLVLAVALVSPFSVSAKTKAGAKPGSFFYFFDKAFEKADLFFTFSPEKKAKKILEYAEERLAEEEELKKEKEEKETLETKKEEKKETEKISEKEVEKADNKLEEEKNKEAEIKSNKKDEQSKEVEKLKKEIEALKQKTSQIKVIEKIVEKPVVVESKQSSSNQTKQRKITLPNGAVVEMDENGNVVRTIKEAIGQSYIVSPATNIQKTAVSVDKKDNSNSSSSQTITTNIVNKSLPSEISIQNQICNLSQTNFKTEYQLYELLQNSNIDGRIFMNAYIMKDIGQNYYITNPSAKMIITTSNHSNDKILNGSGNTGPCGYYYPYEFYATQVGTYTITYSVPEFNLSKTINLNIIGAEKPIVGSIGITTSSSQKETDYPLNELANLNNTSNIKYWFQTSKSNYRHIISAWCQDTDTPFSKVDVVSSLGQDGLYYYRGYFRRGDSFSGITTCKFIHSTDSSMTITSESDNVTFDVK